MDGRPSWELEFDEDQPVTTGAHAIALDDGRLLDAVQGLQAGSVGLEYVEEQIRRLADMGVSVDEIAARGGMTRDVVRKVLSGVSLHSLTKAPVE